MVFFSITSILTLFAYALLIFGFIGGWRKAKLFNRPPAKTYATRCSIIIAARNEAGNIGHLISNLVQQEYSGEQFEIIIVDDHSDDKTADIISPFKQNNHVILLHLPDEKRGKKDALELGISQATGELIITLDADCSVGNLWLSTIVSFYNEYAPSLIICPVDYIAKKGLWNEIVNLEFLILIGSSASATINGQPFLSNGANSAFRRDVFNQLDDPFYGSVSSGDDVFLLHKVKQIEDATILFLKSPDAIAYTESTNTVKDFFNQRIRWASKTKIYKDKETMVIATIIGLMNIHLAVLFFIGLGKLHIFLLFITVFGIKLIIDTAFFSNILPFFNKNYLMRQIFFTDFLYSFYVIIVGILSLFYKPLWKGRIINT